MRVVSKHLRSSKRVKSDRSKAASDSGNIAIVKEAESVVKTESAMTEKSEEPAGEESVQLEPRRTKRNRVQTKLYSSEEVEAASKKEKASNDKKELKEEEKEEGETGRVCLSKDTLGRLKGFMAKLAIASEDEAVAKLLVWFDRDEREEAEAKSKSGQRSR